MLLPTRSLHVSYVLHRFVDQKMLIGVACGRGLRLATKLQYRHDLETNVGCFPIQYGFMSRLPR